MDPETLSPTAVADIDTASLGHQRDSDLAALTDGGFVSVYVDDGQTSGSDGSVVQARIFDDTSTPLGPDFIVYRSGPHPEPYPHRGSR